MSRFQVRSCSAGTFSPALAQKHRSYFSSERRRAVDYLLLSRTKKCTASLRGLAPVKHPLVPPGELLRISPVWRCRARVHAHCITREDRLSSCRRAHNSRTSAKAVPPLLMSERAADGPSSRSFTDRQLEIFDQVPVQETERLCFGRPVGSRQYNVDTLEE